MPDEVQSLTIDDILAAFNSAGAILGPRVDELVAAALPAQLAAILEPLQDKLNQLEQGVNAAATTAAELEGKMQAAGAEAAGLRADLAANTTKTDATAATIEAFLADLETQRKAREAKEEADRKAREVREAAQDARFRDGVRWAVGATSAVLVGLLINIMFAAISKNALPPEAATIAIGVGVFFVGGFLLWWRVGFPTGRKPLPPGGAPP